MAASDVAGTFTDGVVQIDDAGGNSATLARFTGAWSISGLKPGGAEPIVIETQGVWRGTRKGARAYPQITVAGLVADYDPAFQQIANGLYSGYVSTSAGEGDYPAATITISADYSTDGRTIVASDAELDSYSYETADGGLTQVSMTFTVRGVLTKDGRTYVPNT
jgi:hypothetical protein